jgi:VIT1/CCC1 family predicted Fe2+/Mn2+ transporter
VHEPADLERVRQVQLRLPEPPKRAGLQREDWLGAVAVFLWVFLCTFPVVLPFLFAHDPNVALRLSNAIAVAMLFATGYAYGRSTGLGAVRTGVAMLVLGLVLVAITIALGG